MNEARECRQSPEHILKSAKQFSVTLAAFVPI